MNQKMKRFDLYRFQILPKNRYPQGELFGRFTSLADLLEHKNAIFAEALRRPYDFDLKKTPITTKLELEKETRFLLKIAPRRLVTVESREFEKASIPTWPSVLIVIDNAPDEQTILIEQRKEAFQFSSAVANALASAFNDQLSPMNLKVFIEPQFKQEDFWDVVEKNYSSIREIKFELITPNMANISAALNDDLKSLAKNSNAERTLVTLASAKDSNLKLSREDTEVESLVDYSSKGGGNISVRIRGIRNLFYTAKRTKSVEIDELNIEGRNAAEVLEILRGIGS